MKRNSIVGMVLLLVVILGLVFGSCIPSVASTPQPQPSQGVELTPIDPEWTPPMDANQPSLADLSQVVDRIKPSVVAIDISATTYDVFNQPQKVQGAGSGWILDSNGYIVTNNHVVEGADTVTVTLSDGRIFPADMVRTDALTDLAVVKINADNIVAAPIGDAAQLNIADWVVAIGNSLGMGISATVGVVSALDVSLQEAPGQTLHSLIQTDAAINPGNSGGPLVNTSAEVVGINSIKIAQVGVEGMGYAISINEAIPTIQKLIEVGYVVRPWLGINAYTMSDVIATRYNLAVSKGVLITAVVQGGPADKAGLEAGDIITSIDDTEINTVSDLVETTNSYDIGQTINITYWRGQSENKVNLVLEQSPAQ
jgi:serine protease Do